MNRRIKVVCGSIATVAVLAIFAIGVLAIFAITRHKNVEDLHLRSECQSILKAVGIAIKNYHFAWDTFPPGTAVRAKVPPERRLSWLAVVGPFMSSDLIPELDEPWDGPENEHIRTRVWQPYCYCPADAHRSTSALPYKTNFVGIAGIGKDAALLPITDKRAGVFGYDRFTRTADIRDGTSVTMMVAETALDTGPWLAGGPPSVRGLNPNVLPYIGKNRQFGGLHHGGVMVLFADGSVRFLKEGIDPSTFEAFATIAGGETVPNLDSLGN